MRTRPRPHKSTSTIYAYAETLRREMLEEYRLVQEAEHAAAEAATNGVMISKASAKEHWYLTGWDVMFAGRAYRERHQSEELRDHLAAHPVTTRTAFERQWLENHLAGAR